MLIATTGTSMGSGAGVAGLIVVGLVVATVKAAMLGHKALRTGVEWRGVRAAAAWLLVPYALALLLGGPGAVVLMLRAAVDGTYVTVPPIAFSRWATVLSGNAKADNGAGLKRVLMCQIYSIQ